MLRTQYLGLELDSPLILGASPWSLDLDVARRAEDAGASAIVMASLFEEQVCAAGEALTVYPPERAEFAVQPDEYLERIAALKSVLGIPVIASLNGSHKNAWLSYAALMDQAGADAIELNVYRVSTDFDRSAESVERETLDMVRTVVEATSIPVAVKLQPYYTSLAHFARAVVDAGARGLVLFNRFYQPDIDIEGLERAPRLELSRPSELLLRLSWLAALSPFVRASFAATGGARSAGDVLKAVLAGADVVQLVSEVLAHGVGRFTTIRRELVEWMTEHGYPSLACVRGSMNLSRALDPAAFERANYLHVINSWRAPALRQ
ncbi:MAG: dihydroorotate dehydrogenase-like protein [Pseudomonadota bacterium]|nr:MAG: dihydroorotate dehydrogenase-like protein [Pseudomonadota bacterium]